MNLMSLHRGKDEDLEGNINHMIHAVSIHISIYGSYQTWSLPKVMEFYLGG